MTPAQTIKQARKTLGVGQKRFGAWIGVTHDTVRRWEHEQHPVPKAVLLFLDAYFHNLFPDPPEPSKEAQTWAKRMNL